MHPWFAAHGYACFRVDRRGCGDSEGLFDDEYSEQELRDGEDIIAWLAAQPWCNGNVGMQGISWGGFNGMQIAARRPKALKAVISIGTTVDRFADDIHYKGGIQLGENIGWAATAASWFSTPPDPILRTDWRESWLKRLENAPFLAERWAQHSDRDDYWKHGSVCEAYNEIDAAVLVIGGQHDGYRNAMAAMLENSSGNTQAIMGPWGHKYPHVSTIGPAIDYLNVALRWWDRWLKDINNGAESDPAYRVYVMDSIAPNPSHDFKPGKWLAFSDWPSEAIEHNVLGFGSGSLGVSESFSAEIETNMRVGRASGEFFPFGFGPGELPDNQTVDDVNAVCFDRAPLDNDQTIIGAPEVRLKLACDKPQGQVIVRLSDVRPDGQAVLISLGMLNLRHRYSFEEKTDLEPDEFFEIRIPLDQSAYKIPAGHQLRLSVSGSYWPYCWPEGENFCLTLTEGSISLPILTGEVGETEFDLPPPLTLRPSQQLDPPDEQKEWQDHPDGTITMKITGDHGSRKDQGTGLVTQSKVTEFWSIDCADPASASVEMVWTRGLGRGNWNVNTECVFRMKGEATTFQIEEETRAWEAGVLVFERKRSTSVPR